VDSVVDDFFYPCLSNSVEYKRGVGYFTSGWLSQNSKGLARFIQNGGKVKYIISPIINEEDLKYLQGKFDLEIIDKKIIHNLEQLEKELEYNTKNLLGWLIYDGLIEFRFAIPRKNLDGGDFHDKFGIFIDKENNLVTFNGSMNETMRGFLNSESINVFCSWKDETSKKMCDILNNRFDTLWNNQDENIFVYKTGDIIKNRLIKLRKQQRPYKLSTKKLFGSKIKLRDYQLKAYENWKSSGNSGILSMATGSGKTITAFNIIQNIISQENIPINEDIDNNILQSLLIKRASIIKKTISKIQKLKDILKQYKLVDSKYNLFYCDSGKINNKKMVDEVYELLRYMGMNVQKFTSFDTVSKEERQNLLKSFEEGIVEGLVAIKCLDEGVDVPAVKRAFLLSSSGNPKEFIQRRGRVLRKHPSKEFSEIYDFIVVPKNINKYSRIFF
jgi:hypothetical protein